MYQSALKKRQRRLQVNNLGRINESCLTRDIEQSPVKRKKKLKKKRIQNMNLETNFEQNLEAPDEQR